MRIITFPKIGIERMYEEGTVNTSKKALISICSTVDTPLKKEILDSYDKVLCLKFDDLPFELTSKQREDKEGDFYGMDSFGAKHYLQLHRFIKYQLKGFTDDIFIHCTAGISRSGAVGVGVCILKESTDLLNQFIEDNNIVPNQLILSYFIRFGLGKENTLDLYDMYYRIMKKNKSI